VRRLRDGETESWDGGGEGERAESQEKERKGLGDVDEMQDKRLDTPE
jgi:hypothetical protein